MKKKFLSGLMALAIAIPCAFGLVGCGEDDPADPVSPTTPTHTHSYTSYEYKVEEGKAYKVETGCDCEVDTKTELQNYVIATTTDVLEVIAEAEEGKTVVLTSGDYEIIKLVGESAFADNITILGTTNTKVDGFVITSGKTAENAAANDAVSSNLTVENINFTRDFRVRNCSMDGIKVLNSTFTRGSIISVNSNTYTTDNNAATENYYYGTEATEASAPKHDRASDKLCTIKNIVVEGCDFSGSDEEIEDAEVVIDQQTSVFIVGNSENVTIKNNTFSASEWNAIQLASYGDVVIEGNTIDNSGSRSMRIVITDAETEMLIKNNTMTNRDKKETNNEAIKVTGSVGATVECEGNTYGGEAISTDDQILVSLA